MESSDLLERPSKGGGQRNKGTTLPCGEHLLLLGCECEWHICTNCCPGRSKLEKDWCSFIICLVFLFFEYLGRMTVNMGAEWAGNLLAADLSQSVIAGESEDSICC